MLSTFARLIPQVEMSDEAFTARHRILRIILWLHLPLVIAIAVWTGEATGAHAFAFGLVVIAILACGVLADVVPPRRPRAIVVAVGYMFAADALVHAGGGLTDLHFHFFVVLALVGLYQDWVPFAISVVLVAVHHLGVGLTASDIVFSDPRARAAPLGWAVLHAAFVLAMCGALIVYWRFAADTQAEGAELRDRTTREAEEALRNAAE